MLLASWNVNGIRAVERKGELNAFLNTTDPDILLLQETKAHPDQLSKELVDHPQYLQYYHSAQKPGYAGTAVWVKQSLDLNIEFSAGMPQFEDDEGRIVRADFGNTTVLGIYFPNGGKSPEAWEGKLVFYETFLQYINALRKEGRGVVWAGDVNCAHEEIDLARPKENETSIGFLPEERAWVSKVLANGWVDVFRQTYPEKVMYSWWHLISRARARNVGWRIDYFFVDEALFPKVKHIEYLNDQMGSDHCPVILELET